MERPELPEFVPVGPVMCEVVVVSRLVRDGRRRDCVVDLPSARVLLNRRVPASCRRGVLSLASAKAEAAFDGPPPALASAV